MRRLDIHPRKKFRNPDRHYRSLAAWARSFEGFFPELANGPDGLWYEKIAIFEKAVRPPHLTPERQLLCTRYMIEAARLIRDARPTASATARVYAYLTYPNMFGSFIEVAFKPNPSLFFNLLDDAPRIGNETCWYEFAPLKRPAFSGRELDIPDGFLVLGCSVLEFNAGACPEEMRSEAWAVGELM